MATPPIPNIPQLSLFTLAPSHSFGRQSLKGFEFQTAYVAYVLAGFAAGKEDFVSCRVEAVEDLDALLRVQGTWIERYYQIKSKVQAARRRLVEAIELASESSEYDLYWQAVQQRLFYRMQQMYGRQDDWIRDALDVAVKLANDNNPSRFRQSFGEKVSDAVGRAPQGPFLIIALAGRRFEGERRENCFWVAAYALWRAATDLRLLSSSRIALESLLRSNAAFLGPSDFE